MTHSYQLVWREYFPNENNFEFCRNTEGIVRSSGQYFIYFVSFNDIENRASIKITSQSENTKVLIHTCIIDNCTTSDESWKGGCIYFSQYGHIIITKVFCFKNSANKTPQCGQSLTIYSTKTYLSYSSFSQCKGLGDYAPVFFINSNSNLKLLNESNNECKYCPAFVIFSKTDFKYSLFSSNTASVSRILFFTTGNHKFSESMIINITESSQGITFEEGNTEVTIFKCSFANNKGSFLFYVNLYETDLSKMTILNSSMIDNEVNQLYYSDQGMILNTENNGEVSFEVYLPFLYSLETLPEFYDFQISCNLRNYLSFHFYYLYPIICI